MSQPYAVKYGSRFLSRSSLTRSTIVGSRMMSGELSKAITRGAFSTMTVDWSSRMLNLTFECCLENSSANALANGKPVSAYMSRVIGSAPSSS